MTRSAALRVSRRRTAGVSLIEMMVAGLLALLVGSALWSVFASLGEGNRRIVSVNTTCSSVRDATDRIIDGVRRAQGLTAATASDITWTDVSGNAIRYWRSGNTLRRTVGGLPSGGAVALNNVTGLTFSYGTWSGSAWAWSATPSPASGVAAVNLTVQATSNGSVRYAAGSVRIRRVRCTITATGKTF